MLRDVSGRDRLLGYLTVAPSACHGLTPGEMLALPREDPALGTRLRPSPSVQDPADITAALVKVALDWAQWLRIGTLIWVRTPLLSVLPTLVDEPHSMAFPRTPPRQQPSSDTVSSPADPSGAARENP